jgi:cell wall integrity and stress response component
MIAMSVLTLIGGSANAMSVYNTGYTLNSVPFWVASSSSLLSTTTTSATSAAESSGGSKNSSGHSTPVVGIVVGIVVGVVVLGGLAGVGFFFLRKKQREEMEDLKRQQDATSFIGGKSAGSMTTDNSRPQMWAPDNRLDGTGAARRFSNGSIADNEDFSRRILQVCISPLNP